MLLEVSHSGNPLFTKFTQAIVKVNDCQISVFCMNQEDISVKVRRPLSHHTVNVRELHINTSLKAPPHFYDLCSTPFGYGRGSVNTVVSRCLWGKRIHIVPVDPAEVGEN